MNTDQIKLYWIVFSLINTPVLIINVMIMGLDIIIHSPGEMFYNRIGVLCLAEIVVTVFAFGMGKIWYIDNYNKT